MPVPYLVDWNRLRQRRQHATDVNTARENNSRIPVQYRVGDNVLVSSTAIQSRLSRPYSGPYVVVDVVNQNFNGTVTIRRSPTITEVINIRRLRPFRAVEDADAVLPRST